MTGMTPEQQIREMIARTRLTPQEFATAYNNLTPEQIRATRGTPTTQDWNRAASELAPGSEFHDDPKRVFAYLKARLDSQHEIIKRKVGRERDLERQLGVARKALTQRVVSEMRHEHDIGDGHFSTAEVEACDAALRSLSEPVHDVPHSDTERLEFVIRLLQEFGSDGLAKRIWDKYDAWDRAAIDAARAEKGN